jgi:hypothetical protein
MLFDIGDTFLKESLQFGDQQRPCITHLVYSLFCASSVLYYLIGNCAHIGVKDLLGMASHLFCGVLAPYSVVMSPFRLCHISYISVKWITLHTTFMASHVGLVVFVQDAPIWCGATLGRGLCATSTLRRPVFTEYHSRNSPA